MFANSRLPRSAQRGASIIELMVGLVVAMLVSLIGTGMAMTFTASQRQSMSAGGTMAANATILDSLKVDAAQAGLGFFGDGAFRCDTLNLSANGTTLSDGTFFSPVRITAGTAADQIDLVYATSVNGGASVMLKSTATATSAAMASLLPAQPASGAFRGDAVLLTPKLGSASPCTVRSVTQVTASTATTPQSLTFDTTGLHNQQSFATAGTYDIDGRATLLGNLQWRRYQVTAGELRLIDPLNGTTVALATGVIGFKAQYGVSATVDDTTIATWEDTSGPFATITSANVARVRALRVGLVLRSQQREKEVNGACEASTANPSLFGGSGLIDTATDTTWNCFRYRTVTVMVPLRNVALGMQKVI